jgi:hypothetical protein
VSRVLSDIPVTNKGEKQMDLLKLQAQEAIENVTAESPVHIHELQELQLALVGGGIGNCELG